jgi:hypothetical protein
MGRAESESRQPLWQFWKKERKSKDTGFFISLSPDHRERIEEMGRDKVA